MIDDGLITISIERHLGYYLVHFVSEKGFCGITLDENYNTELFTLPCTRISRENIKELIKRLDEL